MLKSSTKLHKIIFQNVNKHLSILADKQGIKVPCRKIRLGQGHLVKGEDSETFFGLLWSEMYN
jgi:pyruvate kinase